MYRLCGLPEFVKRDHHQFPEECNDTEGFDEHIYSGLFPPGKVDIKTGSLLLDFRGDVFNFWSTLAVPYLPCSLAECLLEIRFDKVNGRVGGGSKILSTLGIKLRKSLMERSSPSVHLTS